MIRDHTILKNHYADSIVLMKIAADLETLPNIQGATAVMATESNLELAVAANLISREIEAQPNDLLVAVSGDDDESISEALALAKERISGSGSTSSNTDSANVELRASSLEMAVSRQPDSNLALISCPGEYAAAEAKKALNLGMHVMMFSDNVSVEDELELKTLGQRENLLMMGPDCGTAILNGVPLGFANAVAKGEVGIVAASGSGLQQVSSLLSEWGVGISHAIGTGGRDLSSNIGGITMSQGIEALRQDPETKALVLISKPPGDEVVANLVEQARSSGKPAVICFLGISCSGDSDSVRFASNLEDAARAAYEIVSNQTPKFVSNSETKLGDRLKEDQRYIRGVYSGGTFCYEAQLIARESLGPVWSTTPIESGFRLACSTKSQGHSFIDLGDDEFTVGRPHPMIDHRTRHERILQEAEDPETAVILFDIVLGYGANPDPAGEMAKTISEAQDIANRGGRKLHFVGSVCGTELDPQVRSKQAKLLSSVGVLIEESNAAATRCAISFVASMSEDLGNTRAGGK